MVAATLVAARLLQFSAALALFGAPLFFSYGIDTAAAYSSSAPRWSWERRMMMTAAAVALLGAIAWVMAETVLVSNDASNGFRPAALWTILLETPFGRACLVRIALLLVSIVGLVSMSDRRYCGFRKPSWAAPSPGASHGPVTERWIGGYRAWRI